MSQTSTVVKSQRSCDVSSTNNGQESATQFFAPSWVPQTSELHSILCTKLGSANIRTATQFFAPSWVPQTSELHSILCTKLGSANIRTALSSLHQVGFRKHPNCSVSPSCSTKKKIRADIVSLADFKRSSTEVPRSTQPYTPFQLDILLQLLLVQRVNLQCSRVGHLWHLRQRWHV